MKNKKEQFSLNWGVGIILAVIGFFISIFANAAFEILKNYTSLYYIVIGSGIMTVFLIWKVERITNKA